jgi:arsenate reductase (glutaredoxin)
MEMWINPKCSKCRTALAEAEGTGAKYTERRYLETPPTEAELEAVLQKLGKEPWEITRMKEPRAAELELAKMPKDRAAWIKVLSENPTLIERPIIVREDGTAYVARGPETLKKALAR